MTMKYVVDYKATDPVEIVSFKGYNSPTDIPEQAADVARVVLEGLADVASLGAPVLDAVAKFKGVAAEPEAVWESLVGGPKKPKADAPTPEKKSGRKTKKDLQSGSADGNPAPVAGETSEGKKQEKKMAKVKKASKKAAKKTAKKSGAPKGPRGEKTLKVKAMLERKSGCTRKEVLEATGWPAISMQAISKACGLKLKQEKEKGKPIRYWGS